MNIQQLTEQLETQINQKLEVLGRISKEILDLDSKILDLANTIKQKEKQMEEIIVELKPVEYIVRKNNPDICAFLDHYIQSREIADFRDHSIKVQIEPVNKESDFDLGMTISSFDNKN